MRLRNIPRAEGVIQMHRTVIKDRKISEDAGIRCLETGILSI